MVPAHSIRSSRVIIIPLILFLLCSCDQKNLDCTIVAGLSPLLKPGQVLLIGELHGTEEGPGYIRDITCNALANGLAVSVGLELLQEDQQAINDYLLSQGTEKDQEKVLRLNFWGREYQDGRASMAMFQLIENIRQLKQSGNDVDLVFIDDPSFGDRNQVMANRILKEAEDYPNRFIVVLTGNYHNMIWDGSGQMGELVLEGLGPDRVVSLVQSYTGGSAWVDVAGEGFGPIGLKGSGMLPKGIYLNANLGEYHGTLEIDSIHHSRPAKELLNNK
jgi:hypothetical protein